MWHSLAHHTIMFSLLADKLDNTFRKLRGLGKISEKNIADALRDIRLALLEADVEFGVAREFIGRVKERAMGQEVLKSIKPGEQIGDEQAVIGGFGIVVTGVELVGKLLHGLRDVNKLHGKAVGGEGIRQPPDVLRVKTGVEDSQGIVPLWIAVLLQRRERHREEGNVGVVTGKK